MKASKRVLGILALAMGTAIPPAFAGGDSHDSFDDLGAQWWQWALSIPAPINPINDTTGANCFVGQRGPVWFLAGSGSGKETRRTCSVPEGTALFFPVINQVGVSAPVCDGSPSSVAKLRADAAAVIDAATGLSVKLDNRPVKNIKRVRSEVFATVFPEDNFFGAPCLGQGLIYSPSVDDGYYVKLPGLRQGTHHLSIQAASGSFFVDVFYTLKVVKTATKESD